MSEETGSTECKCDCGCERPAACRIWVGTDHGDGHCCCEMYADYAREVAAELDMSYRREAIIDGEKQPMSQKTTGTEKNNPLDGVRACSPRSMPRVSVEQVAQFEALWFEGDEGYGPDDKVVKIHAMNLPTGPQVGIDIGEDGEDAVGRLSTHAAGARELAKALVDAANRAEAMANHQGDNGQDGTDEHDARETSEPKRYWLVYEIDGAWFCAIVTRRGKRSVNIVRHLGSKDGYSSEGSARTEGASTDLPEWES